MGRPVFLPARCGRRHLWSAGRISDRSARKAPRVGLEHLAVLFANPKQRQSVLGYTQVAFGFGGMMVTAAYYLAVTYGEHFPAIYGAHEPWRYTLLSGLIPAIP